MGKEEEGGGWAGGGHGGGGAHEGDLEVGEVGEVGEVEEEGEGREGRGFMKETDEAEVWGMHWCAFGSGVWVERGGARVAEVQTMWSLARVALGAGRLAVEVQLERGFEG